MNNLEGKMGNMTGRKDLGIRKLPPTQAIPVQSKSPTRTSDGLKNYNMKRKMSKVMKAKGMIKDI